MKVTLRTIADATGFSITTVSRALAGYSDVNADTRRQITTTAEHLGYQPNLTARYLRSKKTNTIGLAIPGEDQVSDPYFVMQMPDENELRAYRRMVGSGCGDGVVVARALTQDPPIQFVQKNRLPCIPFRRTAIGDHPYIEVDGAEGMHQLVVHLINFGHQRIALISSPKELAFTLPRCNGYRAAVNEFDKAAKTLRRVCCTFPFHRLQSLSVVNDPAACGGVSALKSNEIHVEKQHMLLKP